MCWSQHIDPLGGALTRTACLFCDLLRGRAVCSGCHLSWTSVRHAWMSAPRGTRPRHLQAATCSGDGRARHGTSCAWRARQAGHTGRCAPCRVPSAQPLPGRRPAMPPPVTTPASSPTAPGGLPMTWAAGRVAVRWMTNLQVVAGCKWAVIVASAVSTNDLTSYTSGNKVDEPTAAMCTWTSVSASSEHGK